MSSYIYIYSYLFTSIYICLSVTVSLYLSVCTHLLTSVCLSVPVSLHLSICTCLLTFLYQYLLHISVCQYKSLYICTRRVPSRSVCLNQPTPVYLSVPVSLHLFVHICLHLLSAHLSQHVCPQQIFLHFFPPFFYHNLPLLLIPTLLSSKSISPQLSFTPSLSTSAFLFSIVLM